jgi:hypothetical protein
MNDAHCGNCRWFKWHVDEKTKRRRPTERGTCTWPFPFEWPNCWPSSMKVSGWNSNELDPSPPRRKNMYEDEGKDCVTWNPVEPKQKPQELPLFNKSNQ